MVVVVVVVVMLMVLDHAGNTPAGRPRRSDYSRMCRKVRTPFTNDIG